MKFKVNISGVTPHLVEAKTLKAARKQVNETWGDKLKGRDITVVAWKEHTVASLIKELRKFPGKLRVCFPGNGGTVNSQFLPTVKAVLAVETLPAWSKGNETAETMVCFESHVIPSNVS